MFSSPPTNHFASGPSHSSTFVNGHRRSCVCACPDQNPSRSRCARSYTPGSFTFACAANAGGGGKLRSSWAKVSSAVPVSVAMRSPPASYEAVEYVLQRALCASFERGEVGGVVVRH